MANEASKFTMADGTDVSIVDSRIGDLTTTGITGSTVAAQLKELNSKKTERFQVGLYAGGDNPTFITNDNRYQRYGAIAVISGSVAFKLQHPSSNYLTFTNPFVFGLCGACGVVIYSSHAGTNGGYVIGDANTLTIHFQKNGSSIPGTAYSTDQHRIDYKYVMIIN